MACRDAGDEGGGRREEEEAGREETATRETARRGQAACPCFRPSHLPLLPPSVNRVEEEGVLCVRGSSGCCHHQFVTPV